MFPNRRNQSQRERLKIDTGYQLVPMDNPRTSMFDPSDPILKRSLNLTFNSINFIPRYSLSPLRCRVVEAPWLRHRCRSVVTRSSHLTSWLTPTHVVALTETVASPAHYLDSSFTSEWTMIRPVPVPFHEESRWRGFKQVVILRLGFCNNYN